MSMFTVLWVPALKDVAIRHLEDLENQPVAVGVENRLHVHDKTMLKVMVLTIKGMCNGLCVLNMFIYLIKTVYMYKAIQSNVVNSGFATLVITCQVSYVIKKNRYIYFVDVKLLYM